MSKKLIKSAELIEKTEEKMLQGINTPSGIRTAIKDIRDNRTAKRYIDAVKHNWAVRTINGELERKRLLAQSERSLAEVEERALKEKDNKTFSTLKNTSLREREEQKKLLGLDEKRFVFEKGNSFFEGLSDEERHKKIVKILPDEIIKQEYDERFTKTIPSGDSE